MMTPPRASPVPAVNLHPATLAAVEPTILSQSALETEPSLQVLSGPSPVSAVSVHATATVASGLMSFSDQVSSSGPAPQAAVVEKLAQNEEAMEVNNAEMPSSPTLETKSAGSARSLKQLFEQKAKTARQNSVSTRTSRRTVAEAVPPATSEVVSSRVARRTWTGNVAS